MATASIPVDLFNPGQVFACLGFLEAAEVLLGHAEGGFAWTVEANPCFTLRADGEKNPFHVTLEFLAKAKLQRLAPKDYSDSDGGRNDETTADGPVCELDTFPAAQADWLTLPVRLAHDDRQLDFTHWCDGSSRNRFKLFAGQQRSAAIMRQMLDAFRKLWNKEQSAVIRDPFGLTVPLGGSSFKFDARKAWTAIGAGYSPDEQGNAVDVSPLVEILAAGGLEHARPDEFETREVRYAAWKGLLPTALARAALGGVWVGVPNRMFRFTLDLAGKNKVVTFAREETNR